MKRIVLHPFLFFLFSVLSLYTANADRAEPREVYRLILVMLAFSGVLLLLFHWIIRDWQRAGLLSSIVILLFSTYGHVNNLLSGWTIFGMPLEQDHWLGILWGVLLVIMSWAAIRKIRNPRAWNEILNGIAILCIMMPTLQLGWNVAARQRSETERNTVEMEFPVRQQPPSSQPPDIYYIILDEYGREDVLKALMDYDNNSFVQYLGQKGFYVSENSHANYIITHLSLASSLNFQYLGEVANDGPSDVEDTIDLVQNNAAVAFLQQNGYQVITFSTGHFFSELSNSDYRIVPPNYINDLEMAYIESTALMVVANPIYNERYRSLMLNIFDSLENAPYIEPEKPKFVFAHILATHVPFVFGSKGEAVEPWNFASGGKIQQRSGRTYVSAYKDQLTFVNKKLIDTIETILERSERKPVIILQSDHGPESRLDWFSLENTCIKERTAIFNAYYFPDADYEMLYPTITPVNSFRVVFNQYLGTNLRILEDKTYFSTLDRPLQFIDVTDKTSTCTTQGTYMP